MWVESIQVTTRVGGAGQGGGGGGVHTGGEFGLNLGGNGALDKLRSRSIQ